MSSSSTSRRNRIWIVAGLVVLGLAVCYLLACFVTTRHLFGETSVAGTPVGGMSRAEAVDAVDTAASTHAASEIEVVAGENTAALVPAESGVAVDAPASVAGLTDFTLDPREVYDRYFGGVEAAPVLEIDEATLDPVLASVAEDLGTDPKNASIEYSEGEKPKAAVVDAVDGALVEPESIEGAVRTQWLTDSATSVTVEPASTEAEVTTAEAHEVVEATAEPAVSGPVVIDVEEDGETTPMTISPRLVADTLTFEPKDGTLAPKLDSKKLTSRAMKDNPDVGVEATDATYEIVDGKPTVVPAKAGVTIDADELGKAVMPALTSEERTGEVEAHEEKPEFTTAEAKDAGVKDTISDFSTGYESDPNRDTNLKVASASVKGTVLMPGEQFSLNDTLGERTAANGYKQAGVISGGQMSEDYGGGVSQVSTTLFNAAFFAGLQLDEHQAHSRYISRYPEGRESTLDWTSIDLKFTNDSDTPVVIDMYLSGGEVHAKMYGKKTVDVEAGSSDRFDTTSPSTITDSGDECTPQSPKDGWSITIYRTITDHDSGAVVKKDDFTTVYKPVNEVKCS